MLPSERRISMDTSFGSPSRRQWLAVNAVDAGHVARSTDMVLPRSRGDHCQAASGSSRGQPTAVRQGATITEWSTGLHRAVPAPVRYRLQVGQIVASGHSGGRSMIEPNQRSANRVLRALLGED